MFFVKLENVESSFQQNCDFSSIKLQCSYKHAFQWRSQNAEKVTNIKGRLPDQAVILFNCVPIQKGTSFKGKNLLPEGANYFL